VDRGSRGGLKQDCIVWPMRAPWLRIRTFQRSLKLQHPRSLVQITGPQPPAGKQVIGVPVPGNSVKPACGRCHVSASSFTLFFINTFSRSVIAQHVRGRYSRLVRDDGGELVSQPEIL
jgi:hypothetical protein